MAATATGAQGAQTTAPMPRAVEKMWEEVLSRQEVMSGKALNVGAKIQSSRTGRRATAIALRPCRCRTNTIRKCGVLEGDACLQALRRYERRAERDWYWRRRCVEGCVLLLGARHTASTNDVRPDDDGLELLQSVMLRRTTDVYLSKPGPSANGLV